jgi:hypothetical protein
MAGLVPAIHIFDAPEKQDVDARDFYANARKTRFALLRGHDERERRAAQPDRTCSAICDGPAASGKR